MNIEAIQKETERHAKVMSELIGQLKTHILSLPDNPRIKRLSNSPNCFTMSSKNLGNNWSVEHHDFRKQYQIIVAELEASKPANVFKKLHKIIKEGKIAPSSGGKYRCSHTLHLHPDVVFYLRKLADMPPVNCPTCNGERVSRTKH